MYWWWCCCGDQEGPSANDLRWVKRDVILMNTHISHLVTSAFTRQHYRWTTGGVWRWKMRRIYRYGASVATRAGGKQQNTCESNISCYFSLTNAVLTFLLPRSPGETTIKRRTRFHGGWNGFRVNGRRKSHGWIAVEIDRLVFFLCFALSALLLASFISLFELLHSSFKSTIFFENFNRLKCIIYFTNLNQNGINKIRKMLSIFWCFERAKNNRPLDTPHIKLTQSQNLTYKY